MPTVFDLIYREFCRARLVEMRKQLSLWPGAAEGSKERCDAVYPDDVANCARQERDTQAETSYS